MKPHNLILFVLLIASTSLFAQKRAQRPHPVKQAIPSVENVRSELQREIIPVTINGRAKANCAPSRLLTSTNNQGGKWSFNDGQIDTENAPSMADRFTNPGSGTPDINHSSNLNNLERKNNELERVKLGVGDLEITHLPASEGNN